MAKKKSSNSSLIVSILYIIVGILLAAFPGEALNIAMTVAGVIFLISGIIELVRQNWIGGIISLVIGIAILVMGWLVTDLVLLVLGILIAIKGIISLVDALRQKKPKVLQVLFPILTIVIGLVLAFGNALHLIVIIGGVLLAVHGVLGLVGALKK